MAKNQTIQERTRAGFNARVRQTLSRVLDLLSVIAATGLLVLVIRTSQFGRSFFFVAVILVLLVLTSIVLRKDRHLPIRAFLVPTCLLALLLAAVSQVGAAASSLILFPIVVALATVMFGRSGTVAYVGAVTAALCVVAYAFVSGYLVAPSEPLSDWSRSWQNWTIAVFTVLVATILTVALVKTLSQNWKLSDTEAANSARQFEVLVETSPDAIALLDVENMRFLVVNPQAEELFGLPSEKLLAYSDPEGVYPKYQPGGEKSRDLADRYLNQALEGEHPKFLWTFLHASGKEIPCEVSLSRLPPNSRKLVRVNIVDISQRLAEQAEREGLQQQLNASQRLESIGQLTGGVAHDFNNLLAVILGNLQLLDEEPDMSRRKALVKASIDATLRGADLTRSMLSYARRAPLSPENVDLSDLVENTRNWAGRVLPAHIEVKTSLQAGLWTVDVDPGLAESALLNLILNARDAMPGPGRLTIETANVTVDEAYTDSLNEVVAQGRYVMVAVSDTGHGIDEATLERVFEPFFSTKKAGQGSGLGLSMVQGFMRQSGGTVQVHSEVGAGTTFRLYFPAVARRQDRQERRAAPTKAAPVGQDRILVAEDEATVRAVIVLILESAGYSVVAADSGDAAKSIFEADPTFDLLLTDIVMPGNLQGTGLLRSLREIREDLPVVFMSGYAEEATVHGNGLRPGDIRLTKPVKNMDLLRAVAEALAR